MSDFVNEVRMLQEQIQSMPGKLGRARVEEQRAKQIYRTAKEDYEFAVIEAQMEATEEQIGGKNAEERKRKLDAYLAAHPSVIQAREDMDKAEASYADAQLETQREADVFSAARNEARLLGSLLAYLGGDDGNEF